MEIVERRLSADLPRKQRVLSLTLSILFGMLLAVLCVRTAQVVVGSPPSFDGAMNLQVADSIARGEGYRRNYAARRAFPHEIQTGPPYILPAAVVFKLAGVGIAQSEIVNLGYWVLLLVAAGLLIAQCGGRALAFFGACTLLVGPGVHLFGFYGYGEIPSLALALAATLVYFRGNEGWWPGLAGGILLACAVYTKTVMLIGAGALGLCAFAELLQSWRGHTRDLRARFLAFVAGGVLVVVAMEVWRALALGGRHAWRLWWKTEVTAVFMQAGVQPGLGGQTHSILDKFVVHLGLLGHDYRMSLALTGLWLACVLAAFVWALVWTARGRRGGWQALTILLIAVVYLSWWLWVTPTAKAWHRRILDGMLAADLGVVMVVAMGWTQSRATPIRSGRRALTATLAVLALALPCLWLAKGVHVLLGDASAKSCSLGMSGSAECAKYNPGASEASLLRLANEVRALPADAYIFGFGWYSAPRTGLFSGRHILDFHDVPIDTLQLSRPVYFVQGVDTPPDSLSRIRKLYEVSPTPDYAYGLIQGISMVPKPLVAGSAPVLRHIEAADNYTYLRGFNGSEGANGRWLTDDNQVLLTPRPGDVFELVAYVLPIDRYEVHRAPNIRVGFDGCTAPMQATQPDQVDHLFFAIPAHCEIQPGKPVSVRIEVDNLVDSSITHDARALGVLARSFGFVAPTQPQLESRHQAPEYPGLGTGG